MARKCTSISYAHIKRDGNKVAHNLARLSSSYKEVIVWMEDVPSTIKEYVLYDISHIND